MKAAVLEKEAICQEACIYGVEIRILNDVTFEASRIRSEFDNALVFENGCLPNGKQTITKDDGWVFLNVFAASDRKGRTSHELALENYSTHVYNYAIETVKRYLPIQPISSELTVAPKPQPQQSATVKTGWVAIPQPAACGCYLWTPAVGQPLLVHVYVSQHPGFEGKWMATAYLPSGGVEFCVELESFADDAGEGFWSMFR